MSISSTVVEELKRIAYLLERRLAPSYRVEAFRRAARALEGQDIGQLAKRNQLRSVRGVGATIEAVVLETLTEGESKYRRKLEDEAGEFIESPLRAALKGDLHVHTNWSDGGAEMIEMVEAAIALGHEYVAITDHSPSLRIARGLSIERLEQQFLLVEEVQRQVGERIRILTGSETDILLDGSLDWPEEYLARLDIVVGSIHNKLRLPAEETTARLLTVMENPYLDVLGHPTGKMSGVERSTYDHAAVFAAAAKNGVALEINCTPARLDLKPEYVRLAASLGCRFSIDTDAHAPGQLEWQGYGVLIAEEVGLAEEQIINTRPADDLLELRGRPARISQGLQGC
ncbi:MAG TPA: PHP domain-containing protein [Dehalococcoidia bacterium]|nr:PHP domain-containing protein [Dehalococcoidia bacterium]